MSISALLFRLGLALILAHVLSVKASSAEAAEVSDAPVIETAAPPIEATVEPVTAQDENATEVLAREATIVRESTVLKQAEKLVLKREAEIIDPIRELLLREATILASATEKPEKKTVAAVKYDRVSAAEKLVANHDFRMAVALLRDIDSGKNSSPEEKARAQLLLAKIDLHQNRPTDAVVKLSAWLGDNPRRKESPFVYYLLGQAYRDLGVYELARDNFYRVMSGSLVAVSNSDDPNYSGEKRLVRAAVWQLAETEYMHHNWERALTFFDRFYTQNPTGDQLVEASLYRKADCQYQMRHRPEAIAGYEKALAVAPFHPFAPEAWLRLYFLYGAEKQPQKQAEAMQALTWVIKNLQPNRLGYWQQRAVAMVMELPVESRSQLVTLRDGLRTRAEDPSWKPLYGYLNEMCSRITLDRNEHDRPPQAGSPQSADEWAQWKGEYTRKREQLQEQAKPLLERQPVGEPAKKKGVPTQG